MLTPLGFPLGSAMSIVHRAGAFPTGARLAAGVPVGLDY
jgi:hypothetical protein